MTLSILDRYITQTDSGITVPSAVVTIYTELGVEADLFEDKDGVIPVSNPVTADANGRIKVYMESGKYSASAAFGGDTVNYPDIIVGGKASETGLEVSSIKTNVQNYVDISMTLDSTANIASMTDETASILSSISKTVFVKNRSSFSIESSVYIIKTAAQVASDGDNIDGSGSPYFYGKNHQIGSGDYFAIRVDSSSEYVDIRNYTNIYDGSEDIDTAKDLAVEEFRNTPSKIGLYFPVGTWLFNQLKIPDGCRLKGDGIGKTILKNSDEAKDTIQADPTVDGVGQPWQTYLPFVFTENAGTYLDEDSYVGIHVSGITFDWSNASAGSKGGVGLWISNTKNYSVIDCNFINMYPSFYSKGRGASLLVSYTQNGTIKRNRFEDAASYEELGLRYSNNNISITNNLFAGKGTWRHNIEIASADSLSTVATTPYDIRITNNEFRLHYRKQDCISFHRSDNVVVSNNTFRVMDDLVDTGSLIDAGYRCLVKKFDDNAGTWVVTGNIFDYSDVPSTIKRGFEAVRVWANDATITGNTFKVKFSSFDDSIEPVTRFPVIGTGYDEDESIGYQNVVISSNAFEVLGYTPGFSPTLIKTNGQAWSITSNTVSIADPTSIGSGSVLGPIFIDVVGTNNTTGFDTAQSIVVNGNAIYSGSANSFQAGVRVRGSANFYTIYGNTMSGCRARVEDTALGSVRWVDGNPG